MLASVLESCARSSTVPDIRATPEHLEINYAVERSAARARGGTALVALQRPFSVLPACPLVSTTLGQPQPGGGPARSGNCAGATSAGHRPHRTLLRHRPRNRRVETVAAPFGQRSGQHSYQDASDGRTTISALAEFAESGEFGKAGLDLLRRVVRHELSRLPVLLAGRALDDDVAWDFVGDFFVEKGHRVVPALLAESEDDASLVRQLRVIVRNWLIDKMRETDQGSVGRRIREVLEEEGEFERVPDGAPGAGRWRLVGTDGAPWGGRLEDLVAAAYGVPARAVRWSSETRRAPIASRSDLVAMLKAIAQAAGYRSLELLQIVAVIMRRFPATLDPETGSADLGDDQLAATDPTPETIVVDRDEEVTAAASAIEVFAQLTPSERRLLLMIDDVDAVRAELGCGRSTAYNRIAKFRALVLELSGRFDDPEQILREVLELCAP